MDNIKQNKIVEKIALFSDVDFTYGNILKNLADSACDDFVKIFSIINISKINTKNDFDIIIKHLTNHPTPIREALAIKLEEICLECESYLLDYKNLLIDSVIDINPNVSRSICSVFAKSCVLSNSIEPDLILRINCLLTEIKEYEKENKDFFDNKLKNRKNHAKNKKLFSLYWLLEALSICLSTEYSDKVTEILRYTVNFSDYTIREKTAKILAKMSCPASDLITKIASDQNFYVKNQVYDKINFDD